MKTIKVNDCEVSFVVDTYADMFHRKAVLAFVASGDEKKCSHHFRYGLFVLGGIGLPLPSNSYHVCQ